jgi:hypothetical protein
MNHWLVYHSQRTMQHSYASLAEHAVYSTKEQTKLCFGDVIWVIEGSMFQPTQYSLVDCFRYTDTRYPPFPFPYSSFKLKILGKESLLSGAVSLDIGSGWQRTVHSRFLTKQRFFVWLQNEPDIAAGLIAAAGIRL